MTTWPFTTAQLTAGLRRYFSDSSLRIVGLHKAPLATPPTVSGVPSSVNGLRVEYEANGQRLQVECVVKEPRGAARPGVASVGLREVGVYRSLALQLPMQTPAIIAADSAGEWLVLEAVAAEKPSLKWDADEYRAAVRALASLHERFWNLGEDLAVYPWLSRPLTNDFEFYVYAAVSAMEKIMVDDRHPSITRSLRALTGLGLVLTQIEQVVAILAAAPPTLLHGDFRPGNIALQEEAEMVVFDWQLAGIGPGVLDIVTFVNACRWERADLPIAGAELMELYRSEMEARVKASWTDEEWQRLIDHALMWRFTQEMFAWAASASTETFAAYEKRFHEIWLEPVLEAAAKRLRPALYL
jgi:hypothetical protein